jgi:glucan phosphoethanolaminetransferase (alkaline phosphatase superfamily)
VSSASTPSEHTPSEGVRPATGMPTSVRVAVIVMSLLAGLLLLSASFTWVGREGVIDRLMASQPDLARADAARSLLINTVMFFVIGLLLAVAAWSLPRRHAWARWVGLAVVSTLALLTLVTIVAGGGISIPSLLVLILSTAAITSLVSRTTGAWFPRLRPNG